MDQLKQLDVIVGGLCMLVQSDVDPVGLFVLMPAHQHEPHCPLLVVEGTYTEDHQTHIVTLDGKPPIDLRPYSTNVRKRPLRRDYLRISSFVNPPRAVEGKWLTETPNGVLAARVELPLNAYEDISAFPETGMFKTPNKPYNVPAVGRTLFSIGVTVPYITRIELAGLTLIPSNGRITLSVFNIRGKDFPNKKYKHSSGHPVHHAQAYYRLLKGWQVGEDGPEIKVGADQDGIDDDLPPVNCSQVKPTGAPRIEYIDPYNCTIGVGCAPNQDDC